MICWSIKSTNVYIGISIHKLWPPMSPAPVGYAPSIEGAMLFWIDPSGRMTSTDVKFDGRSPVLKGHDIGKLIPTITLPPANLWLIIAIATSSAEVKFAKHTVEVNGTPAGAHFPFLMPMKACGDPFSLPTGIVPDVIFRNTVVFGLSLADLLKGWFALLIDLVVEVLIDLLFKLVGKGLKKLVKQMKKFKNPLRNLKNPLKYTGDMMRDITDRLHKPWQKMLRKLPIPTQIVLGKSTKHLAKGAIIAGEMVGTAGDMATRAAKNAGKLAELGVKGAGQLGDWVGQAVDTPAGRKLGNKIKDKVKDVVKERSIESFDRAVDKMLKPPVSDSLEAFKAQEQGKRIASARGGDMSGRLVGMDTEPKMPSALESPMGGITQMIPKVGF